VPWSAWLARPDEYASLVLGMVRQRMGNAAVLRLEGALRMRFSARSQCTRYRPHTTKERFMLCFVSCLRAAVALSTLVTLSLLAATPAFAKRDDGSGALLSLDAPSCWSDLAGNGCGLGPGTGEATGVAVSPDGRSVYGAALRGGGPHPTQPGYGGALTVFSRDWASGALTWRQCFAETATLDCTEVDGLGGAREVLVSGDGRFVYVATTLGLTSGGVLTFARDRKTGLLHVVQCITEDGGGNGCVAGDGINGAMQVDFAPDEQRLYVGAQIGGDNGAIAAFRRDTRTGLLTQLNCVSTNAQQTCTAAPGLDHARGVTVSPDGDTLYTTSISGGVGGALGVFHIEDDGSIGAEIACYSQIAGGGCAAANGLVNPTQTVASEDGPFLYVSNFGGGGGGGVTTFRRQPNGDVTELGCISENAGGGCTAGDGLAGGSGIAISADGRNVYVDSNHGGIGGAVASFRRDGVTGKLTQVGCLSENAGNGCAAAEGLVLAEGLAVSPDDHHVYVAAFAGGLGGSIAAFKRDR
jgi:DNA-binding beta-propeller fold protein YncE